MNESTYKKKLSLASFVAPLITLGLLLVFWQLGQKWVVFPASVILVFLFFFLPKVVQKKEEQFHKKALLMLTQGNAAQLPSFARKQILLSIFGSSAPIDAKLGLAYVQIGEFEAAIECLQNAIPHAPQAEYPALLSAYIKSLFVTGDPARAEAEGLQMIKKTGIRLPEVLVLIARSKLGLGKAGPQVQELLDEEKKISVADDISLMTLLTQIEFQIAHNKKVEDLPSNADSSQAFLKVWVHYVRGKIREGKGKNKEALSAYAKAVKEGGEDRIWFAELARGRAEIISKHHIQQNVQDSSSTNEEDSVYMKKKRRR